MTLLERARHLSAQRQRRLLRNAVAWGLANRGCVADDDWSDLEDAARAVHQEFYGRFYDQQRADRARPGSARGSRQSSARWR